MRITNDNYKVYYGTNFRNVYLDNNRIMTEKKVNSELRRAIMKFTIEEKLDKFINFIKNIFKK